MDLSRFPRAHLAHLPTPLEPMPALSAGIGGPRLLMKRDDCTGLAFGGNKTRKLEFVLGEALARRADTIIVSAGWQSNLVRQTAAAAARLGLRCHAVVSHPLRLTDVYEASGNMLLDRIFNAQVHRVADEGEAADRRIAELVEEETRRGHRPFVVPPGASSGIGALGYVNCAAELLEQCWAQGARPARIVLGTGSAGTHGGLLAGLRMAGSSIPVTGISVSEPSAIKVAKVRRVVDAVLETLGAAPDTVPDAHIEVLDDYVGAGYGSPTKAANAAIKRVARCEGILLDPVYTGKVMAATLDLIRRGTIADSQAVVVLHTGGTPALFSYPEEFAAGHPVALEQ